jgi:hypothetical protein
MAEKKKKKMLVYEIKASITTDPEQPEISEVLDYLRGYGEAEISDVKVVEVDDE